MRLPTAALASATLAPAILTLFGAVAHAQVAPPPPFVGFGPPAFYPAGKGVRGFRAGDLTGDGFPDIAVANSGSDDMSILVNRDDGTFFSEIRIPVVLFPFDADIAWLESLTPDQLNAHIKDPLKRLTK